MNRIRQYFSKLGGGSSNKESMLARLKLVCIIMFILAAYVVGCICNTVFFSKDQYIAFSDCSSLTTVVIPDTVGTIRRGAFISCTALTTLDIPASVTEIMEEAFTGCAALKDLTIESSTVEFTNWWVDTDEIPSDLTITCPKDSKIAAWAEKNNVATEPLS